MSHLRLSIAFVVAGTLLAGSGSDDWARVKALPTGTKVTVVQSDMKSVRGALDAASDGEMVVAGATIPKARVVRVSIHKSRRRVSNAVVLAITGGLIGAAATRFGIACAETNDGCRNAAMASIGGAAGGAVIGSLALPETVEVYRVKKLGASD